MKTWETVKEEIKNQSESDRINIEAIGLTQKQLAEKINVSQSAISRFESQVSSPRLDLVLSIMGALDLVINVSSNI